jgi:hypothetical protein
MLLAVLELSDIAIIVLIVGAFSGGAAATAYFRIRSGMSKTPISQWLWSVSPKTWHVAGRVEPSRAIRDTRPRPHRITS